MPEQVFRHRGGGRVIGIAPAVSSDSTIDSTSIVEGRSRVSWGSRIRNESAIKDSEVVISALDRVVAIRSHIAYAKVRDAVLTDVIIRGADDPALVENSLLSGGCVIEGCKVSNAELDGPYLLHNDWDHTPRHYLLETPTGIRLGIAECMPGFANIGCKCRSIEHWIRNKETDRKVFMKRGWPYFLVDEIHELFLDWTT